MGNHNPNRRETTGIAFLSALAFLGSALMLSTLLFPSAPSNAKTAGAEVGVTVKEFIKLAVDTSSLALKDGSNNTVINPSPAGTMISGDVNLAVTTNTVKGYTLSAYTADSSTSMSNSNPSVTTNISSIATASGYNTSTGISDLAANTWGFQKSAKNDTATGNWFGVGANSGSGIVISSTDSDDADFCENLSYPLANTGCNSSTYDTYNIKFGAKLTSALPAGTYTNNVVFSAVAKSEGTKYTLNFNANNANATGTMNSRVMLQGSTITIPTTTYQLSGYKLLGWALTSSATTAAYTVGQTVAVDDLISAATTAGQTPAVNSQITLYAIWKQYDGDMQNWAGCSTLSIGQSTNLQDTRDGYIYRVKKLSDGNCWMIENLTLGSKGGLALTPADTNIDNNTTYYLPPAGKQGNITSSATTASTTDVNFSTNSDNQARVAYKAAGTTDNVNGTTVPENTGYYSFYTATLGYSYYNSGSSGSSTRDICPKGWRLPWTSDAGTTRTTTADFYALADSYNPNATWTNKPTGATTTNPSTTDATVLSNMISGDTSSLDRFGNNGAAGFTYAGRYSGTTLINVGTNGYYWSSSIFSSTSGYGLYSTTTDISPEDYFGKIYGSAIRCIAKDPTMQDFDANSSLPNVGDSAELMDTRDGKIYTVKRLKDGKVWMMQNLTIGSDGAKTLTSTNTNIDDGKTYYLPPASKQGSSTIDDSSTLTATATADFGDSDNCAKTQFRTKDSSITNDSDTGYYNFYTATLGFSYYEDGKTSGSSTRDICPKGWRLPKTTDNGSSVASGSPAEFTTLAKTYNPSASWTNAATSNSYYTSDSTIRSSTYLSAASPLATSTQNNYAGFSYAGYWFSMYTSANDVGSYGAYWSSSVYNAVNGYVLSVGSSDIHPQGYGSKYMGLAVRCVAKP